MIQGVVLLVVFLVYLFITIVPKKQVLILSPKQDAKSYFFTIILGLLLFSCKKENKEAMTNLTEIKADSVAGMPIDTIHSGDNSETSLDWDGVYVGTTPCANCEGIETELSLGKDKTFVLKTKYVGKGAAKINTEKELFLGMNQVL